MTFSINGSPVIHMGAPKKEEIQVPPLATDRLVIPAKSVGNTLPGVIRYALERGFRAQQIVVVANGRRATEMARIASATAPVRAVVMDEILDAQFSDFSTVAQRISSICGIERSRLHGKGTAMFVGALELVNDDLPETARIFFLDADIKTPKIPDPLGHLIYGWSQVPSTVRLIKLAALNRDNEAIHALCAQSDLRHYNSIGAFTWPLCGQQSLLWSDLKRVHMASGYAVELSLIAELLDAVAADCEPRGLFAEVVISNPLNDRPNSDHSTVRMYVGIGAYLKQRMETTPAAYLTAFLPPELNETGGPTLHIIPIDATLPSVVQVV